MYMSHSSKCVGEKALKLHFMATFATVHFACRCIWLGVIRHLWLCTFQCILFMLSINYVAGQYSLRRIVVRLAELIV